MTTRDTIDYIGSMASELAALAADANQHTLAYILEIAALEAAKTARPQESSNFVGAHTS